MSVSPSVPRTIDTFQSILAAGGIPAALEWLNDGVAHRYTTIYRLQGDILRNVHLHDEKREAPPDGLEIVQLRESFCQVVFRDGGMRIPDSRQERRFDGSPFQGVVIAYHAVPVASATGELIGTLCHFDFVERSLSDTEFSLLEQAGRALHGALAEFV